ncbi:superfamily II DNA/RNA helicase [Weissella uvarum]|uniref:DEAD/DEAH box helicase n=1 Tax=Weissella uvarum TaxID=1479233 RepID=UPI001961B192|nr:DEAD/DEAH box helicase [Weissella uvarum]MBM7617198.1 superfamily II DNA/RNA helicase [Weissella uvarum]MCM0595491.1 DEAD/DEAH box helicase [Weissella uvarum]
MHQKFEDKIQKSGFTELTPIQKASYEPLQAGESVNALAPTGTGKTLAFTWPLLENVVAGDGEQVLVLAPSQELAMQTTHVMREWANELGFKVLALTGGANIKNQLDRLKKHPEILVGTPGRVVELINNGKLKLGRLRTLVLDEADELMRDETAQQIDVIWDAIDDADVQVAMFGATAVDETVASGVFDRDFKLIDQRDVPMPTQIKHEFWLTASDQKNKRLRQLAAQKKVQAMVFFNTTKQLKNTANFLAHEHVGMATLVRGDSSSTREKAMRSFKNGDAKFLLTTDVGARGLDVPDLPMVINFDLPRDGETYTHRSGRTGRMGKPGLVITFGNDHDARDLKRLVAVDIDVIKGRPRALEGKTIAKPGAGHQAKAAAKVNTLKPQHDDMVKDAAQAPKPKGTAKFVKEKAARTEVQSRDERFAKEKKAKRKHKKDKGKPKPKR